MKEFLAMGGYGFYIWLSYGVVAVVLIANIWILFQQKKRIVREIEELRSEDAEDI